MSLTNPKNVVTEERLNEYHQTILPYLGGMPDILANKFSRADLYSTDEKMIGRWIDGKPLYQKVIEINPYVKGAYTRVDLSSLNIDTMVSYHGFATIDRSNVIVVMQDTSLAAEDTSSRFYLEFRNKNSATEPNQLIYRINYSENTSPLSAYITIKYTKTTDSPVEIGLDTDYSTEEKIVGTWIDGKPLYQKTMQFSIVSGTSYYNTNIINIKDVIRLDAYTCEGQRVTPLSAVYANANDTPNTKWFCGICWEKSSNKILIESGSEFPTENPKCYVTLQYTKTTD